MQPRHFAPAYCLGLVLAACFLAGCDSLRFAPSERQKQNAWLHTRTTLLAAQTARAEGVSPQLQALATLSAAQSEGYSALCGGAAGARVVRVLRDLRAKAAALQEVVAGNEVFKVQQPRAAEAFKAAQVVQSPQTRQIVATLRAAASPHPNGTPRPG